MDVASSPFPSGEFFIELYDLFKSLDMIHVFLQSWLATFVRGMNACLETSFVCPKLNEYLWTTLTLDGIEFYDNDKKHNIYCSGDYFSRNVRSKSLSHVSQTYLDSTVRVMWNNLLNRVTLLSNIFEWAQKFEKKVVAQMQMCKWMVSVSSRITYINDIHVQWMAWKEEEGIKDTSQQPRKMVRKSLRRYVFDVNKRPMYKQFLETFSLNKEWFISQLQYHASSNSITCYACEK